MTIENIRIPHVVMLSSRRFMHLINRCPAISAADRY